MRRFFVLVTVAAAFAALNSVACGDANKPPLTPDSEHDGDAGAPAAPATPAPPTAPK